MAKESCLSPGNQKAESPRQNGKIQNQYIPFKAMPLQSCSLRALSAVIYQYIKSSANVSALYWDPLSLVPASWRSSFLYIGETLSMETILHV